MQPQCNEGGSSLDPLTSREDEPEFFVPVEPASETISKADCLIITGTTLINDTLEELLRLKKADARVVLLGPTAGMLPEAFFRRDVDVLGGHHGNECRPTLRFDFGSRVRLTFFRQGSRKDCDSSCRFINKCPGDS